MTESLVSWKDYPGKRPKTVWESGRTMYEDDDDYDDDDADDGDDGDDDVDGENVVHNIV